LEDAGVGGDELFLDGEEGAVVYDVGQSVKAGEPFGGDGAGVLPCFVHGVVK
jgi:hypothetical protein